MYLSKLEIFGFKSFAQKTNLKLTDGISCIIGPNGSGKSNIVDAIRWVLGEQKVTTLRTDRMENIIFSGTNSRKPLGMAEVSLTIQNNKNILNNAFSEVVIARRLYRSGESHYLLNKAPCRLKDIIDLFMDTGMGANSYSVIELSMVETIISDNADERRHLFEEAAGVTKYKTRRKSALRKLDATLQDMSRISDIISEIKRNVNSLSRQVGKARRYLEYKDELKHTDIDLARFRFTQLMDDIQPLEKQLEEISLIKEDTSQQITLEEALLEEYKREIIQIENRLQGFNRKISEQDDKIAQLKQEDAVSQTRAQALKESLRRNDLDRDEFQNKITVLKKKIQETTQLEGKLADTLAKLRTDFQRKEADYNQANQLLKEKKGNIDQYDQQLNESANALLAAKECSQEKKFEVNTARESINQLNAEIEHILEQKSQTEQDVASLKDELKQVYTKIRDISRKIDIARKKLENITAKQEENTNSLHMLTVQKKTAESQVGLFEQLIARYEGHSEGTRLLMANHADYAGLHGPLSDLLKVDDKYKVAVESALSETINYLVVDSLTTARAIIQKLKADKAGRVTLLPLDMLASVRHQKDEKIWQDDRLLARHVQCDAQYRKIFDILLGDIFLVDSIDSAMKESAGTNGFRYVTPEGELVHRAHAITGGQKTDHETSLLGRKERLEQVKKELQDVEQKIEVAENLRNKLAVDIQSTQHTIADYETEKESQTKQLNQAQQLLAQKTYHLDSLQTSLNTRRKHIITEETKIADGEESLHASAKEITAKQKAFELVQDKIRKLNKLHESENIQVQELNRALHEQQLKLIEDQNKFENVKSDKLRMLEEIGDLEQQIQKRQNENENIQQELIDIELNKEKRGQNQQQIWQERDKIDNEKGQIQDNYHQLKDKIINLEAQIKKYRKQHDSSLERSRQLELQIQENRMKAEGIKERIKDEYNEDVGIGIALNRLDIAETEQKIDTLKYKISQLGQVNPLAVSEYEKESERLEFYTKQYNDLQEAEKSLRKTINKINITARQQFLDTFTKIKENFERVFSSFFLNGEGTLKLEDDTDPLEGAIEIMVRPKGKRMQTINLLSGGEKTLTAISLLFAIYLVKPSPFCILDEIDAPLDDVNISRFTKALSDFSNDTQFIVVTHNKNTMEAADTMYGVTMEEEGLSKLVSVKFN